eukprot:2402151-Rhodomonas_salina.3
MSGLRASAAKSNAIQRVLVHFVQRLRRNAFDFAAHVVGHVTFWRRVLVWLRDLIPLDHNKRKEQKSGEATSPPPPPRGPAVLSCTWRRCSCCCNSLLLSPVALTPPNALSESTLMRSSNGRCATTCWNQGTVMCAFFLGRMLCVSTRRVGTAIRSVSTGQGVESA